MVQFFLTKKSLKELTLEHINNSVKRLLQLLVLLHGALLAPGLLLLPLVQFESILLEQLQRSLSILLQHKNYEKLMSS